MKLFIANIMNKMYLNWEKKLRLGYRSGTDRRSSHARRKEFAASYLMDGGDERRQGPDRRRLGERRSLWQRIGQWTSVYLG